MHATLRRFESSSGTTEDIMPAADQLASLLSRRAGFVSFALLEVGERAGIAITVFETQAELVEADEFIGSWAVEHRAEWLSGPPGVTTGEVIVQRGM